ncbi:class I SAM-dependent methyltransferase [Nanoarchaeota archaeon]
MAEGSRLYSAVMKFWYSYISRLDKNKEAIFLNYGYVDDNNIELKQEDETNRYPIQLYHQIANSIDLSGLNVLEVGCGRGGGASYVARYLKPKSIKGIDRCKEAVKFCSNHHSAEGLSFSCADALDLPFEDNAFDAVINVESSHCYTDINKFLSEVNRILKPKGHFLLTDFRNKDGMTSFKKQLTDSGLIIIKEKEITSNVVDALNQDSERRLDMIKRQVPKFFHKSTRQFAGVKGSELHDSFATGKRRYFSFVLQKP